MDCSNIDRNELAEEYLNGALDEARQSDFEIHILECQKCLEAVEVLQAVGFDLSDRAPAIRTYSYIPHRNLRWAWVAVVATVILAFAVGTGKLRFRSTNTHTARNSAPEIGAAPTSGLSMNGQRGSSNTLNVDGDETTDNSVRGVRSQIPVHRAQKGQVAAKGEGATTPAPESSDKNGTATEVAAGPSNDQSSEHEVASESPSVTSATNSGVATTAKGTADQAASELSELAAVRPFPYTFAGVAGTQPSSGGSVRVQHPSGTAISGTGGTGPKGGASGFRTATDYFRDGMSAYVNKDYVTASQFLGEAVRLDPELSEAGLYLGICRLLQGNPTGAVPALQPVSKVKKPTLAQPAHFYLAKAYLQMGKLKEADTELHAASSLPGRLAGDSNALMQRVESILNGPGNK